MLAHLPLLAHLPMRLLLLLFSLCIGLATAQDRRLERKLELTPKKEADAVVTRALTWLTGGAEENDYVSVGRLANYFGFVRFRVASGHSLTRGGIGQRTWAALDKLGRSDMLIIAGCVIPPDDFDAVRKAGAAEIFPPGTVIPEAAEKLIDMLLAN